MTVDIERFLATEGTFAVRFSRDDLPGLLSKKLEVPAGHLALIKTAGGETRLLEAGAGSSDLVSGTLVKVDCKFELELDAGSSKDNLGVQVALGLELKAGAKEIDLRQLEQELLKDANEIACAGVEAYYTPFVRDAVRFFVSAREAKALVTSDQRVDLEKHLRKELEKPLFETGMIFEDVVHPKFSSEEFDARQKADAEADAKAGALAREREILDIKKALDKDALLADIELRDEADRARKEKRLERYEDIRQKMGEDDVKALIMMLDDDKQRAVLIRELIEKDMTPDQRAKLKVSEMEDAVESRLKELHQKLAQLTGAKLERGDDPITRRVLCVVGKRVLAFDPKTNLHPEVPKEVYDTEGGGLGYLRSVRNETIDGEDYLLAGAQRGIYRINGTVKVEYPFPDEPKGKGGANAVAYFDGRIYATHSEVGLIEWPYEQGAKARNLCGDVLDSSSSIRGATMCEGLLYFSSGSEVYSLDVATGSETPKRFKGSDDSITSFLVLKDELVAGNKSGKIYRWSLEDPNSPEAFNVIKQNPIFMLRYTKVAGQGFFIIGSKDFTVTLAEPRKDLFREYQAREEVRWVDGAADYIFGVSRSGYKVFCWDSLQQKEPQLTIRVSDKVQDLFVVKMLPQKVTA